MLPNNIFLEKKGFGLLLLNYSLSTMYTYSTYCILTDNNFVFILTSRRGNVF